MGSRKRDFSFRKPPLLEKHSSQIRRPSSVIFATGPWLLSLWFVGAMVEGLGLGQRFAALHKKPMPVEMSLHPPLALGRILKRVPLGTTAI